jgi:threonine dehydratase
MLSFHDIHAAAERLRPYLAPTPLERFSDELWLKLENANQTHSFKVRGALNAVLSLSAAERAAGIVTASSGNHAQGVAYAAHLTHTRARVLMPRTTPKKKIAGVVRCGAEPVLFGESYGETEAEARRLERADGITYVSPYNEARVAAGNGTVGMEIIDALPDVQRIVVPVGGGGLISGIATAVKAARPAVEIIGVNPAVSPDMYNVFYGVSLPTSYDTLADALPGEIENGSITIPITRQLVDQIVLVDEAQIAAAMRWLIAEAGWLVEGGGAVGIAALLAGVIPGGKKTAAVVSGGNVDLEVIRRVIA